ncbi:MAG: hypothetical protein HKN80_07295, partial [Acidimicrobiia bacterium]|nr:hypothetical protein [Acidimicrobiia bacterium]
MTLLTVLVFPTGGALAEVRPPIDCVSPTLQAEITAATAGDTIVIVDGSTCTGNFTVNKLLTIQAETATGATLDGNGVDGAAVMEVTGGGDLTLQDLTVTGGVNSAGDGGGIRISTAAVTLVRTTVTANSASNGGGIWSDGTLDITDSFITNNTATLGGGGLQNINGGDVTVTNTEITGNDAEHGGGVLNNGAGAPNPSTMVLTDSLVSTNTATGAVPGDPAGGGGIYNFSFPLETANADLTLTGTVVDGNTSAEGAAGIRNEDGTVTIDGSTVTSNTASGSGGGIRTSGVMTVTGSDISENTATS